VGLADPNGLDIWDWLAKKIGPDNIAAWDCCLGDPRDGWFANATDFCAGWGDTLSFGITKGIRYLADCDGVVDFESGWYTAGEVTGFVHTTLIGGACGWRAAGQPGPGKEFSHWIPQRYGGCFRRYTKWNGNYVTKEVHACSDPYRWKTMPYETFKKVYGVPARDKAGRIIPDKMGKPVYISPWSHCYQQWVRIPKVYKGGACGMLYGGGSILTLECINGKAQEPLHGPVHVAD